MDWPTFFSSPLIVGIAAGLIGAIGGYFAKRAEKAPDLQIAAAGALVSAFAEWKAINETLKAEIRDLTSDIEDLSGYIDQLVTAMRDKGIEPPVRRARKKESGA